MKTKIKLIIMNINKTSSFHTLEQIHCWGLLAFDITCVDSIVYATNLVNVLVKNAQIIHH